MFEYMEKYKNEDDDSNAGQWSFYDFELRNKSNNIPVEEYDKDRLFIEYWNEETEIQAEISVKWHYFPRYQLEDQAAPQLRVFEDSWLALYRYGQEFLKMLAENENKGLTKEQMKEKLLAIGFVDKTLVFD